MNVRLVYMQRLKAVAVFKIPCAASHKSQSWKGTNVIATLRYSTDDHLLCEYLE